MTNEIPCRHGRQTFKSWNRCGRAEAKTIRLFLFKLYITFCLDKFLLNKSLAQSIETSPVKRGLNIN